MLHGQGKSAQKAVSTLRKSWGPGKKKRVANTGLLYYKNKEKKTNKKTQRTMPSSN